MHRLVLNCTGTQGEIRWRGVSTRIAAWMASGLLVAGACSAFIVSSPLMQRVVHRAGFVFLCLLLAQIGVAIVINGMIGRFPTWQAVALFLAYSTLNGFGLAGFFLTVSHVSLTATFLIAATAFALLSIYGMVTRRDLTKIDGLVLLGLIGVSLVSLVHGVLHSSAGAWFVSYVGVAMCVGLIAADARKMKHMDVRADDLRASRLAILGALALYVDFLLGFARVCAAVVLLYAHNYEGQYLSTGYYNGYFPPMMTFRLM